MSFEPDSIRVNAGNIKALAHPLRVQILGQLRTHGPATASGLGARLGLSSGALSYHLRQLERYGFVVEDTERGDNRDRWWRSAHRSTEFRGDELDPVAAEIGEEYERSVIEALHVSLSRAYAEQRAWPASWQGAFDMSDTLLQLTADQAKQLAAELVAVFDRYPRHTAGEPLPDGSEIVAARYQVHPLRRSETGPIATGEES